MNAPGWMGDDNRDELTQREAEPCADCGAAADQPCAKDCGCPHCRAKEWQQQDHPTSEKVTA